MKLKISSHIPCNLFFRGEQLSSPQTILTDYNERITLSVLPSSPEAYSSYTLVIDVKNDTIISLSGGAQAICWGDGYGEILLSPPATQVRFTPEILAQKKLPSDLVTLYDDGIKKVMCEGTSFYTFDLPQNVSNIKMKSREINSGAMVTVQAKVLDKDYLLALYSDSKSWKIMHSLISDKITVTPDGVTTEDVLPTMLRHLKQARYTAFNPEPQEIKFVPTVRHTYPDSLIPYLFFESVFCQNAEAINYLDPSLSQDLSALREFIGDVDTVSFPECGDYALDTIALYNSKARITRPDLYKIVVEKGKIINIIHLLTCN